MAGKQGKAAKTERPIKLKNSQTGDARKASAKRGETTNDKKGEAAPEKPNAKKIVSTREFFLDDFSKTPFPLQTNRVLVERKRPAFP